MDDQKITTEELKTLWAEDVDALAQKVAQAINAATPGAIIDESEEPVRDANAVFREKAYQKALGLLQDKNLQEAFSPSADPAADYMAQQGTPEGLAPDSQRSGGA